VGTFILDFLFAPASTDDAGHDAEHRSRANDATRGAALSDEERQHVVRIRAGDTGIFERVFRAHYAELVTYLARTIGDIQEGEELAQAVFVRVWDQHADFAPHTSIRAYLFGAARHAALNYFRTARRDPLPPGVGVAPPDIPADVALEQRELYAAVHAAIERLPARAREMWILHRERGLTIAEVAAAMGVSPNTVKTQVARSLVTLRRVAAPFLVLLLSTQL